MIRTRRNTYPQTRAIRRLAGQVQNLGAGAGGVDGRVTTLEGEVTSQAGQITTLEGQLSSQAGQITTLEGQVAAAELNAVPVGSGLFCFDPVLASFDQATGLGSGPYQNYALCDGRNGCPDLRGQFIVGYDGADLDYANIGNTGGEATHTLTLAEIPAHTHTYQKAVTLMPQSGSNTNCLTDTVGEDTGSAGGGLAHENRPPFYVAAYIMRYQ